MSSQKRVATGIDLGNHAVKLIRLESNGQGRPSLTHWGEEEVQSPEGASTPIARGAALRRLLSRLRLSGRQLGRTAAAVSGPDVYIRQVSVPTLSEEDFRRALPYEAKRHLPLENIQNPCLDFMLLPDVPAPAGGGDDPTQEALLVAVPQSVRDQLLEALKTAGVDPQAVDAAPLPSVNAVLAAHGHDRKDGALLVLDLGAERSVLAAVQPGGGLYVRNLTFSGNALTRGIQEQLGLSWEKAESRKRKPETDEAEIRTQVGNAFDVLAAELRETLRFLGARLRARRIDHIYLCGGESLHPGAAERLSGVLEVPVSHADPFLGVWVSGEAAPGPETRTRLSGAVGLARRWEA